MSASRLHEYVLLASLFPDVPPTAGSYYVSRSGGTTFAVAKVRRVVSAREGLSYRLIGSRLRKADVPAGAVVSPWPRQQRQPSRAADPTYGPPTAPPPIVIRAAAAQAERKRVLAIRRKHNDPNHQLVDPIRLENQTATMADWRDPDDLSTVRRTARVIHGARARDSIEVLQTSGTLDKRHAKAARRFRRLYELGFIGTHPVKSLAEAPSGVFTTGGPSEIRLAHLSEYNFVIAKLGPPLTQIFIAVIICDETLVSYAERKRLNRGGASGYLLAAADSLICIFEDMDKDADKGHGSV